MTLSESELTERIAQLVTEGDRVTAAVVSLASAPANAATRS